MTAHDRIEINPKIMLGKPVIRGTRIPVEMIVRKMAEGADEKAVLQAYPTLTSKDVHAALRYAADSLAESLGVLKDQFLEIRMLRIESVVPFFDDHRRGYFQYL